MLLINNINLSLETNFSALKPILSKAVKIPETEIVSAVLYKKSVDARHKNDVRFCCSFLAEFKNEEKVLKTNKNATPYSKRQYIWQKTNNLSGNRPVVVGFGPAGIFAALTLARAGLRPIVIERGCDADKRTTDVNKFLSGGALNPESNVQFGEGGAGTFSDGKLNSGIKDPRCRTVLEEFVKAGAPENILTDAKPHIGTDVLTEVIKNLRADIIDLGGEVCFNTRLDGLILKNGAISAIATQNGEIECDKLVLAIGHSARDTFEMLKQNGISMVRKPFAMGVRIEHLQADINKSLYGDFASHKALSAADYKLNVHLSSGRGVYTFCMCPGGEVINASSEAGGVSVNGMSNSRRDGINANSALLVGVNPEDIEGSDVLAGCYIQRNIEKAAFNIASGAVPVTTVDNFVFEKKFQITKVKPTVKPNYVHADFEKIFPRFITESLKEGIILLDKKLSGFKDGEAVLTAPETRSSSPIRILRDEELESLSVSGLYPCGEGAGYAGGIMSAATDGMVTAEKIISAMA